MITSKKIIREDEVRLYRIIDISLNRTLGQRMFGLGTIKCCSADKTLGDFEIKTSRNRRVSKRCYQRWLRKRETVRKSQAGYPYFIEISGFSSGSYSDYF